MHWLVKVLRQKAKLQNQYLGQLLRAARKNAGLTQTQAAACVGRDQTFIARIESGSQQPTFVEVEQLASGYGKDLSHFQTIEQIETRNHSFAIRPQALAEYTNALLQKRKRKRQKSSGKLHQRRRA